jgi:hypothetical protein
MNYSANKMAAKHCLSAQCIVVDIVPLKLGVVVGKSGRGLNITLQNHNSPVGNSPSGHTLRKQYTCDDEPTILKL